MLKHRSGTAAQEEALIPGKAWENSHSAIVSLVLADKGIRIPVYARGKQFANYNFFPWRMAVQQLAKMEPGTALTRDMVDRWVDEINAKAPEMRADAHILVAASPHKINRSLALALDGGTYHEAWHSRYTCTAELTADEVWAVLEPRWDKIEDWSIFQDLLLTLDNIVEDVRIERFGTYEFPNSMKAMESLQDLMLDAEDYSLEDEIRLGTSAGHPTPDVEEKIREEDEKRKNRPLYTLMWAIRDLGKGYQTGLTRERIRRYEALQPSLMHDLRYGSLGWVLESAIPDTNNPAVGAAQMADTSTSLRVAMDFLIAIQGMLDEEKREAKQKKEMQDLANACEACGSKKRRINPIKGQPGFWLLTCEDCGDKKVVYIPHVKASSGDRSGSGSIRIDPEYVDMEGNLLGDKIQIKGGAGSPSETTEDPSEAKERARKMLEDLRKGDPPNTETQKTLQEAVEKADEDFRGTLKPNETPYQTDPSQHTVRVPDQKTREAVQAGLNLIAEARQKTAPLTARLRTLFQTDAQTQYLHGTPKGPQISERFMVKTYIELQAGEVPRRAFKQVKTGIAPSMAVAVLLDQSGSMGGKGVDVARACATVSMAISQIDSTLLVTGFTTGYRGILHDVYVKFGERFEEAAWRLAYIHASGSTPMADGIQFSLNALKARPERYKMLVVVTDGDPDWGQEGMVAHQVRTSLENGIQVLGVGIGSGMQNIRTRFPDHVHVDSSAELPAKMAIKMNEILMNLRRRASSER